VAIEELQRQVSDYRIADWAEIHYSPGICQADQLPLVFERVREQRHALSPPRAGSTSQVRGRPGRSPLQGFLPRV
jgi:hypothetical protein